MSAILWALIGGTVIGLFGKLLAPGNRDLVPLWLTILCGIAGMIVGDYLYSLVFEFGTSRVDWWRHAWQVTVATLLVVIAAVATARRSA